MPAPPSDFIGLAAYFAADRPKCCGRPTAARKIHIGFSDERKRQLHPVVLPHVSHFMQVPLRTSVKFMHSGHASPS